MRHLLALLVILPLTARCQEPVDLHLDMAAEHFDRAGTHQILSYCALATFGAMAAIANNNKWDSDMVPVAFAGMGAGLFIGFQISASIELKKGAKALRRK